MDEVYYMANSQLHVQAAVPPEKKTQIPLGRRLENNSLK